MKQSIIERLHNIDNYIDTDVYDDNNKWYEEGYEELFDIIMEFGEKLNPLYYSDDSNEYDMVIRVKDKHYGFSEMHGQGSYRVIVEIEDNSDIGYYVVDLDDIINLKENNIYPKEVIASILLERGFKSIMSIVGGNKINIDGVEVDVEETKGFILGKLLDK